GTAAWYDVARRVHLAHLAGHRAVEVAHRLHRFHGAERFHAGEAAALLRQLDVDDVAELALCVVRDADLIDAFFARRFQVLVLFRVEQVRRDLGHGASVHEPVASLSPDHLAADNRAALRERQGGAASHVRTREAVWRWTAIPDRERRGAAAGCRSGGATRPRPGAGSGAPPAPPGPARRGRAGRGRGRRSGGCSRRGAPDGRARAAHHSWSGPWAEYRAALNP